MFHVELRQFPHVARAFNLSREELGARILAPLEAGRRVELNEQRFSPEKVKVTVYEGPELAVEEMGMGRGWGNATKGGEDVTERVLAEARQAAESPPALEELKEAVAARAAGATLGYEELLEMAGRLAADLDANQRVGLVARAVWELLREKRVRLSGG
ncbi:MAG TPA: hypothetical protein VGH24_07305 [Solirubrobacteraceae bacterium]|jgi:hypothetical protein